MNRHDVSYREMRESDYAEVLGLWQEGAEDGTLMLRLNDSRENFSKYLRTSPGCSFVAVSDGRIIGTVMGGTDQHRSFINHLYVSPAAQCGGIGTKLVRLSEKALAEASDARSYITVRKDNEKGIAWWKARGYEPLNHVELLWKDIHPDAGDDKRSASELLAARGRPIRGWMVQTADTDDAHHNEKRHLLAARLMEEAASRDVDMEWVPIGDAAAKALALAPADRPDFAIIWAKDCTSVKVLENAGIRCFNSSDAVNTCDDKALTCLALDAAGIAQPAFMPVPLVPGPDFAEEAGALLGFPLVGKACRGSFGAEVELLDNKGELSEWLSGNTPGPLMLQEFIPASRGRDMRVQVVGGEVVSAMERSANGGDFRANITNGGSGTPHEVTERERELAIATAHACGCDWAGVDLLFGAGGPLVCEVNSNAHFVNLENITGDNVAGPIIDYVLSVLG